MLSSSVSPSRCSRCATDRDSQLGTPRTVGLLGPLLEFTHDLRLDPGADMLSPFRLRSHEQVLSEGTATCAPAYAPAVALDADRRRRSWPYPPTDLERLAERAGLDDDELRASLRRQVAERRGSDAGAAEGVAATEAIDWGEVLANRAPEEIASLIWMLGDSRSPR